MPTYCKPAAIVIAALALASCAGPAPVLITMNQIAERYVKLVLSVGQHDENLVDAYYGDPDGSRRAAGALAELATRAETCARSQKHHSRGRRRRSRATAAHVSRQAIGGRPAQASDAASATGCRSTTRRLASTTRSRRTWTRRIFSPFSTN
jgi:hypothetical protein